MPLTHRDVLRVLNQAIEDLVLTEPEQGSAVEGVIGRLEEFAASVIDDQTTLTLAPIQRQFDRAMAEARRLVPDLDERLGTK